ncbi:MAG TPA: glycosyltransferase [Steroidobacteraceae bacterium]
MLAWLALLIWLYLYFGRGRFWASAPQLPPATPAELPDVDIVVPARDEAHTIAAAIDSLLAQDYAGRYRVILVDDGSTDGTAEKAGNAGTLQVIRGLPKPQGWSGKLWALSQGVAAGDAPVLLFTDADIVHDPRHLSSLVARLLEPRVELVSEMVRLNCISTAERALVPAFVYFFQMLYPFSQVNDPRSRIAAAAGGTVLVRRAALACAGGIGVIHDALIDDVALARVVKTVGPIYLGHSGLAVSIRQYPHFRDIWRMIARTAFTQLRHSGALLLLTLAGMTVLWLLPLGAVLYGDALRRMLALAALALAALSYLPSLMRYRQSRLWALALPLIALFFMAATLGSAVQYACGRGVSWKDRSYGADRAR